MSRVSPGPTSLPPSLVPHAPADKGLPATPLQLPHLGFSVYQVPGQGRDAVRGSGTRTWCPSQAGWMHLLKPAAAAASSGCCGARSSHLKFKLAASAPPRPAREAPASHWLLSQGPPAALPPGAPARCLSRYSSCKGLSRKGVMQTRHPVTNIPLCTVSGLVKKVNSDLVVYACYYPQPEHLRHRLWDKAESERNE